MEEEKEICRLYINGDSITSISKKLHHKTETIKKILIKNNLPIAIDNLINKKEHNKILKSNAYFCKWKGNKISKEILTILYENANIYLIRKKKFYDYLKNK